MITWHPHREYPVTECRGIPALPWLDYLIVAAMLVIACCGYRAVRSAHDSQMAGSSSAGLSVALSCAVQASGGAK